MYLKVQLRPSKVSTGVSRICGPLERSDAPVTFIFIGMREARTVIQRNEEFFWDTIWRGALIMF